MKELGENFSKSGIEAHGFSSLDNVFWNLNKEDISSRNLIQNYHLLEKHKTDLI